MSSFSFRTGGCMWCHPGGGPMEYDRDGYRYDATTGANPNRATEHAQTGVPVVDSAGNVLATNPDGVRYGDYFVFNATTSSLDSKAGATAKGVTEVDCLMCHLSNISYGALTGTAYNNQDRDYCSSSVGDPIGFDMNKGPAMGLTLTGEVLTTTKSGNGINPSCNILGYADGVLEVDDLSAVPTKEACSVCHFPDVNKPKGTGPGATALDFTAFQKLTPVSANPGTDCKILADGTQSICTGGGFCDTDQTPTDLAALNIQTGETPGKCNAVAYPQTKGRAEFGKRGHSINDPANPDVHMATMTCSDCHYAVEGDFAAFTVDGIVIQKAITGMVAMDHNFAHGNNRPDSKNTDQLDNTITCEGCHIPGTVYGNKPGSSNNGDGTMKIPMANGTFKFAPIPTHAAFPAHHFDKIDCRTCHLGENNFVKKQMMSDFSTTPYPLDGGGFERGQYIAKSVSGVAQRIGYKPLYAWQDRGHHGDDLKITPIVIGSAAIWKDLVTNQPYGQRFPSKAAKQTRTALGAAAFPLNSLDSGDDALIANTTTELSTMVSKIEAAAMGKQSMTEAALNIFINVFTTSHGVDPIGVTTLGSAASGGCAACHSANSPLFTNPPIETANVNDPCYGQPDGCKGLVFFQPKDGGIGLEQTVVNGKQRVVGSASFPCPDGSPVNFSVNGTTTNGQAVNNVIPQEGLLCYNPSVLAALKVDQTATSSYFAGLSSNFSAKASTTVSKTVNFDSSNSECPAAGAPCTKSWNFGDGTVAGTGNSPSHEYAVATGVCVGDPNPNDSPVVLKQGTCQGGAFTGTACNTDVDCLYPVTMTITDKFGYSDTSSLRVEAKVLAPAATGVPTVNVSANTVANTATVTVTAGTAVVDYVYIDWLDGTKDANGADIAVGNNRTYGPHTYGFERAYKVRVKVRTKDNVYHYLTGIADVR